ncbi:hypothetical protein [Streptomyces sp. NPDC001380]|uniref:helix-turn-helix domain-containing protein n=1 Tax=Streptomyces sp. NPDC001380 TaxID=3364566 RepID=UPI00367415D7
MTARERLAARGLLDPDGSATGGGHALHRAVEEAADRAAARPWALLGPRAADRLAAPLARACAASLRFPNPIGLPAPD